MKTLDKATEIELIQKLANGGGYFAEYFKKSSADRMCENIKNDFPIEHMTDMSRAKERIGQLENLVQGYEAKVDDITDVIERLTVENHGLNEKLSQVLHNMVSNEDMEVISDPYQHFYFPEIVKAKRELGVNLTLGELNQLFEKAGI